MKRNEIMKLNVFGTLRLDLFSYWMRVGTRVMVFLGGNMSIQNLLVIEEISFKDKMVSQELLYLL